MDDSLDVTSANQPPALPCPDSSSELEAKSPGDSPDFSACIESLGLLKIQRHLFLCADQTKAKCCSQESGLQTWDYLKRRLKELGLDCPTSDASICVFRTKANCLRVCQQGPILLVYPDGVWYHSVTAVVMERILEEHVIGNQVVTEYVLCQHPLP